MTFKGTALVTGAAKRLGAAVALHLAKQGHHIALHYNRSKAQAMKTAQAIYKTGVRCELFACDLSDEKAVSGLVGQVHQSMPNLNLLVNSASMFIPGRFGQDMGLFKTHWDINFKAPYVLSCSFARLVKKGHIINFIDTNVAKNVTRYEDYLLTKKTLYAFTKMAAAAWGPHVRVNGISPGMILSPVNHPDDRVRRAKKIPLQRVGHPKYIVQTLQFLLDNDYLTGQIIANDGGEGLI
ncbi:MAG: SDR family oxidoreductase [Candidatus Omnitrophica bacterium]|nr:SDR family oxidoreductase [Candidatus Omnitrophota bacterium]